MMGCSPPSWWLEDQNRRWIAEQRMKHQREVAKLIRLLDGASEEDRRRIRAALDGEETSRGE
jgi:hypothetical protein